MALTRHALLGVGRPSLAISPDGRTLVYVADTGSESQLYVRPIDSFDARPIAGTEGGFQPFFSPDGRWIGFFAKDKLKTVLIAGGEPTILADARTPFGGTWTANDMIVFSHAEGVLMMRVPASGGAAEQVAAFHPNRGLSPAALPDGTAVLMDFVSEAGTRQVVLLALDTGTQTVLIEDGTGPLYSDTGHLFYMRGASLMAVPFDVSTRLISGSAEVVLQGIRREVAGTGQVALSRTGTLIYIAGGDNSLGSLGWVDRNGRFEALDLPAQVYGTFRIAHDGRRLAFGVMNPLSDIWLYDFERKAATRLTTTGGNWLPSWTAAGRVAYASIRQSAQAVYLSSVDGTATEERLIAGSYTPDSWSAGDRYVAMEDRTKGWDIVTMAIGAGERKPEPFLSTMSAEWGPAFSPGGRYLAYTSDEDGRYQVYVRPFPKTDRKWQVSIDGGEEPVWSRDGRELFYRNGQQWMVADIPRSPEFSSSRPRLLFEGPYRNLPGFSYDVSPDGKRFIVIKPSDVAVIASEVRVILNWHEELRRRLAPASR